MSSIPSSTSPSGRESPRFAGVNQYTDQVNKQLDALRAESVEDFDKIK
jgi:hypothetical protein